MGVTSTHSHHSDTRFRVIIWDVREQIQLAVQNQASLDLCTFFNFRLKRQTTQIVTNFRMSRFCLVKSYKHLTLYQLLVSSSGQCLATERGADWSRTSHSCGLQDAFLLYSSGGYKLYLYKAGGPAAR